MSVTSFARKAAFATAAAATILVASSTGVAAQQQSAQATIPATNIAVTVPSTTALQPQPLTKEECAGIAEVAGKVVRAAGTNNLSVDFRQSFRNWLGQNITCDGPKDIIIKTGADSDAFVTIRGALGVASRPIDIMKRGGLRAIGPTASLGAGN